MPPLARTALRALAARTSVTTTAAAVLPRFAPASRLVVPASRSLFTSAAVQNTPSATKSKYQSPELTKRQYDQVSDSTMDILSERLESLVEVYSPEGNNAWECEYNSGVLTLSLGPRGTYVINKQPPNQQIWSSSPFSGPMRFSWCPSDVSASDPTSKGFWGNARDDVTLGTLLDREIRHILEGEFGKEECDAWEGCGTD